MRNLVDFVTWYDHSGLGFVVLDQKTHSRFVAENPELKDKVLPILEFIDHGFDLRGDI